MGGEETTVPEQQPVVGTGLRCGRVTAGVILVSAPLLPVRPLLRACNAVTPQQQRPA